MMAWATLVERFKQWPLYQQAAVAGAALALLALPFWLWSTQTTQNGEIIVSSPQVYTRERLVNDRYDQAQWLQGQLKDLDKASNLLTGYISQVTQKNFNVVATLNPTNGPHTTSTPPGAADRPEAKGPDSLPFDLEFVIRASIRDTIRELALENALDDRHDLRGSSIYGLKFDTTVIPSSKADSAVVDVSLDLGPLGKIKEYVKETVTGFRGVPQYVEDYYQGISDENSAARNSPLFQLKDVYKSWVDDLEQRLNQYAEKLSAKANCGCATQGNCLSSRELAEDSLAGVLGQPIPLPQNIFANPQTGPAIVSLGKPFDSVLNITVSDSSREAVSGSCRSTVRFQVTSLGENIFFIPDAKDLPAEYLTNNHYFEIGPEGSNLYVVVADPETNEIGRFDSKRVQDIFSYLRLNNKKLKQLMPIPADWLPSYNDKVVELSNGRPVVAALFVIPAGLFSFIERAANEDEYAYALLPRSELAGYLVDNLSATAASVAMEGAAAQVGGNISAARSLREANASPRTVGFVEAIGDSVQFGWLIDSNHPEQPAQKSHLALVSVPAWVKSISLCVRVGWKSEGMVTLFKRFHAPLENGCDESLSVPVPQDMETLDSIIIGGAERPPPRIFSQLMDSSQVTACRPASIIIPGAHLWRNTFVTLGSQRAERITVLPDMRGIVAYFYSIEPINNSLASTATGAPDPRRLRVWTTEGSDTAAQPILVAPPAAQDQNNCKSQASDKT